MIHKSCDAQGGGEEGSSEKRHPAIIYTPVHAVGPP